MKDKVIAVRFKKTGKLEYFYPLNYTFSINDNVIANTERGEEIGRVVKILDKNTLNKSIEINEISRPASKKDIEEQKKREVKVKEVLDFCKKEVKKQNLDMKILTAEYILDGSKLTIYFSSEDRVDFRELVKILASKFKTRIELRQIGPRDEIKEYPTLGMCGIEVCCRTFLQDFDPVTIKMAKEQGLQINMSKLSGACGKLMCCLKYEEEAYKENLKDLPKIGASVKIKGETEEGKVVSVDILRKKVKVKFGNEKDEERFETYDSKMIIHNKKKDK
jgi:cell fate regulator YaaT (PSP1 superfamily)